MLGIPDMPVDKYDTPTHRVLIFRGIAFRTDLSTTRAPEDDIDHTRRIARHVQGEPELSRIR